MKHRRCLRSTLLGVATACSKGSTAAVLAVEVRCGRPSQSASRERTPSTDGFEATSWRRYTSAFRTSASAAGLVASGELGGSRRRSCAQRLRGSRARRRPERSTASTRAVATAVDAVLTRAPVRPHPVAPASSGLDCRTRRIAVARPAHASLAASGPESCLWPSLRISDRSDTAVVHVDSLSEAPLPSP